MGSKFEKKLFGKKIVPKDQFGVYYTPTPCLGQKSQSLVSNLLVLVKNPY